MGNYALVCQLRNILHYSRVFAATSSTSLPSASNSYPISIIQMLYFFFGFTLDGEG